MPNRIQRHLSEPRTLAGKVSLLTVANGIGTTANLMTPFVLVRVLSKSDYGLLGMIFLVVASAHSLSGFNVSHSAAYFVPRGELDAKQVLGSILGFNLAIGLLLLALLALMPNPILWVFRSQGIRDQTILIGFILLAWNCSRAMSLVPIALGRSAASAAYIAATESTKGVFILAPAAVFGTMNAVLIGMLAWSLARAALATWYFRVKLDVGINDFHWPTLRRMLIYALPYGATGIVFYVFTKYHGFLMAAFADENQFAIYRAGIFQIPLAMLIIESTVQVLTPEIARLQAQSQREKIIRVFARAGVRLSAAFIPMFVFLQLMAPEFITVCFTEDYLAAVPIFRVNLLELLIALVILDPLVRADENLRFLRLKIYGVGLVGLGVLGKPVIQSYGAAGALSLTLGLYLVAKSITFWCVAARLGLNRGHFRHLKEAIFVLRGSFIGGLLASAVKWAGPQLLPDFYESHNWAASMVACCIGGGFFVLGFIWGLEGRFGLSRFRELSGFEPLFWLKRRRSE